MDAIRVAIRVRPLLERELKKGSKWTVSVSKNTLVQTGCASPLYHFDNVYGTKAKTYDIHMNFIRPIVLSVMEGFNGTIFAYGQTSSGKTHTMMGNAEDPGIIPLSISDLFNFMHKDSTHEYIVRVSYLEIYNECLKDLLDPDNRKMKIREDLEGMVKVYGITERCVVNPTEIGDLLAYGTRNRSVGETQMNEHSSRSHTIFTLNMESRLKSPGEEDDGRVKVAALNLVDLAGSERVSNTGSEGVRFKEGTYINRSLLVLGNVISKLSEGNCSHVPFRDSKLTRILQSSLGGNAKTAMVCSITPAEVSESESTLKFASRAMTVKNKPIINEVLVGEEALMKRLKQMEKENKTLRARLKEGGTLDEHGELTKQLAKTEEEKVFLERRLRALEKIISANECDASVNKLATGTTEHVPGIYSQKADQFPTSPLISARTQPCRRTVTFESPASPFQPVFDPSSFKRHLEDIQGRLNTPKRARPTLRGRASFIPTVISTPLDFSEDSLESYNMDASVNSILVETEANTPVPASSISLVAVEVQTEEMAPSTALVSVEVQTDAVLPLAIEQAPPTSLATAEVQTDAVLPLAIEQAPPTSFATAEVQTDAVLPLEQAPPTSLATAEVLTDAVLPLAVGQAPVQTVQTDIAAVDLTLPTILVTSCTGVHADADPPPAVNLIPCLSLVSVEVQTTDAPSLAVNLAPSSLVTVGVQTVDAPPQAPDPTPSLVAVEVQTDAPTVDPAPPPSLIVVEVGKVDVSPTSAMNPGPSSTVAVQTDPLILHPTPSPSVNSASLVSVEIQTDTPSLSLVTPNDQAEPKPHPIPSKCQPQAMDDSLVCFHKKQAVEIMSTMQFEADEANLIVDELRSHLEAAEEKLAAQEQQLSEVQDRLEGASADLNKSEELRLVLQKQASDLSAQHTIQISALKEELEKTASLYQKTQDELLYNEHANGCMVKQLQKELQELQEDHKRDVEQITEQHSTEVSTLKRELMQVTSLYHKTEDELMSMACKSECKAEQLQEEELREVHERSAGQMTEQHTLEISATNTLQELQELQEAHEEDVKQMMEQHAAEISTLKSELEKFTSLYHKTQDELMTASHNEQEAACRMEHLEQEVQGIQEAHGKNIVELTEQHVVEVSILKNQLEQMTALYHETQGNLMSEDHERDLKVNQLQQELQELQDVYKRSSDQMTGQHAAELSALKKELEEMTSLYYKTQDELMSTEYNEHESDCKVEELQKELQELQRHFSEQRTTELSTLKTELEQMTSLYHKTQDELVTAGHGKLESESKVNRLQEELKELQKVHEKDIRQVAKQHAAKLSALKKELDEMTSLYYKTQDELMSAEYNENESDCKVEELQKELKELQKKSGEQHTTELSTLKTELEQMTSLYHKTQDELMTAGRGKLESESKVNCLQEELKELQKDEKDIRQVEKQHNAKLSALKKELDEMTSLYYKTQDELMSAEYNEHESDCKVEELQKELKELQKKSGEQHTTELSTLKTELDQMTSLYRKTQDELVSARHSEFESESKLNHLQEEHTAKVSGLKKELEEMTSKYHKTQDELMSTEYKENESEWKVEELEEQLKELQRVHEKDIGQIAEQHTAKFSSLKKELEDMTSLYYKTQDELMSAEYNEHESDCKVEELQKELQELQEVCKKDIAEQHSTEISTLKKELEEMTSLYYKTQDELMSAEYNEDQSDCKVKELQEELQELREVHRKAIEQFTEQNISSGELVRLRQELLHARKSLASHKEKNDELTSQLNGERSELASYRKVVAENCELRETVSAVRKDNARLTKQVQGLASMPREHHGPVVDGSGMVTALALHEAQQELKKEREACGKGKEDVKRVRYERNVLMAKYNAVKETCSCGAVSKIKSGVRSSVTGSAASSQESSLITSGTHHPSSSAGTSTSRPSNYSSLSATSTSRPSNSTPSAATSTSRPSNSSSIPSSITASRPSNSSSIGASRPSSITASRPSNSSSIAASRPSKYSSIAAPSDYASGVSTRHATNYSSAVGTSRPSSHSSTVASMKQQSLRDPFMKYRESGDSASRSTQSQLRPLYSNPSSSISSLTTSSKDRASSLAELKQSPFLDSEPSEEAECGENFNPEKKFVWDQTLMEGGNKAEPNCKTQ